ncbi:MAG: 16S rRNA (cytosine(1402)-N(4))-methyltransferase RsmH [Alphaproteobacteria bacterium]|nr:16S rRNA (cytosine(1402)-N(4))-methyltransferase RsmH [Alphaproteobacteria bacterium]
MSDAPHKPVLVKEMVETLKPKDNGVYVDGTFGAGGYSKAILRAANCRVYALDRDPNTKRFAEKIEAEFFDRFVWILGNFSNMCTFLAAQGVQKVDGVVLDLGVSSMQIDDAERGFSFRKDGPLDMRMGDAGENAADIVNYASEAELADILFYYGEEKQARRIAKAIVAARNTLPITRTLQLADIIRNALGNKYSKSDLATRSFQALRIHVNQEFEAIERGLAEAEELLAPGARMVVVTFHSLEDRLVKRFYHSRCGRFGEQSRHSLQGEADVAAPSFFLPKPEKLTPSSEEIAENPRSRSATLRVMEKL